jgi:hypothetical protein
MAKAIVMNGVSLDGVMQAPGRPDEDTRNHEQGVLIATHERGRR